MSATEAETTFADIVRDYEGREGVAANSTAIAEAILADDPGFLSTLPHSTQVDLLRDLVRSAQGGFKRARAGLNARRVAAVGEVEARIRITAGGPGVWEIKWTVGGTQKQTRDLTPSDLEFLIRDRNQRRVALAAQMKWLMSCLAMAREFHVDALGQLEKRGIALPTLDLPESEL